MCHNSVKNQSFSTFKIPKWPEWKHESADILNVSNIDFQWRCGKMTPTPSVCTRNLRIFCYKRILVCFTHFFGIFIHLCKWQCLKCTIMCTCNAMAHALHMLCMRSGSVTWSVSARHAERYMDKQQLSHWRQHSNEPASIISMGYSFRI